jgi:hypothetical protein
MSHLEQSRALGPIVHDTAVAASVVEQLAHRFLYGGLLKVLWNHG